MFKKSNILIFLNTYLPGYKCGGPIQAISNLVDALYDYFDFYIVTRDRDSYKETVPYENVRCGVWEKVGHAYVRYLSPKECNVFVYRRIINSTDFDLLYLQSFWNVKFSLSPLLALSFSKKRNIPVLLHPRGEFFLGALSQKKLKKKIMLFLWRLSGLYKKISFNVSTEEEKKVLIKVFPKISCGRIYFALDFPRRYKCFTPELPKNDILRLIFLSRINPHKNLLLLIHELIDLKINVKLDIYGPLSDPTYWDYCKKIILKAPKHINIKYCGVVLHENVQNVLKAYDIFCLLTKGENFGYAIHEALSAGLPVIISDQTLWHDVSKYNAGWEISLDKSNMFKEKVMEYYHMNKDERLDMRRGAIQYAIDMSKNSKIFEDNLNMFKNILAVVK